jgi:hypothetical protein
VLARLLELNLARAAQEELPAELLARAKAAAEQAQRNIIRQ